MLQKFPYIISIAGVICGVLIAIVFGVNEDFFKDHIERGLSKNVQIQSIENVEQRNEKIAAEKSKNWRYYQRFHFHSTGLGALALAMILLVAFIQGPTRLKLVTQYALSIGGALYPFVWLFAAIYGPEMGRHQAKEAFAIFGYMGGVYLLASIATLYLLIKYPIKLQNT